MAAKTMGDMLAELQARGVGGAALSAELVGRRHAVGDWTWTGTAVAAARTPARVRMTAQVDIHGPNGVRIRRGAVVTAVVVGEPPPPASFAEAALLIACFDFVAAMRAQWGDS